MVARQSIIEYAAIMHVGDFELINVVTLVSYTFKTNRGVDIVFRLLTLEQWQGKLSRSESGEEHFRCVVAVFRCVVHFPLCCGFISLCCTFSVVLWLISVVLYIFRRVVAHFRCCGFISLCCGFISLCCGFISLCCELMFAF